MVSTMDSQQIKEALAADPYTTDEALIAAAEADSELREYWQDIRKLNDDLLEVTNIPVPTDLESKLVQLGISEMEAELSAISDDSKEDEKLESDNDSSSEKSAETKVVQLKTNKRSHMVQLALAASIAFAVGISFNLINQTPDVHSGSDLALAHMYHELEYTDRVSRDVPLDEVNTKLATFGGAMMQKVGKITYANFCFFEKQKSLHLVMHTENGDITLFVTPKDLENKIDNRFGDDKYEGRSWRAEDTDITIIGEKGQLDAKLEETIRRSMQFSA